MYNSKGLEDHNEQYYEMKYYKYKAKIAALENNVQNGGTTPQPVPVQPPVKSQEPEPVPEPVPVSVNGGYDDKYYEMKYYKYKAKLAKLQEGGSNKQPNILGVHDPYITGTGNNMIIKSYQSLNNIKKIYAKYGMSNINVKQEPMTLSDTFFLIKNSNIRSEGKPSTYNDVGNNWEFELDNQKYSIPKMYEYSIR